MEIYFKDLEQIVRSRLEKATNSVSVAVAWFTNPRLLGELIRLLKAGGSVEVMLVDDEINRRGLDFEPYLALGGKLYWVNTEVCGLMHNKFCVIDGSVSMTGSYNWTNKASYNYENLVISDEEIDAQDYLVHFSELKQQLGLSSSKTSVPTEMLLKRLRLMIETLRLGDEEDIRYQTEKFESLYRQADQLSDLDHALQVIHAGKIAEGTGLLEQWISANSGLRSLHEDRMVWLQIQIELLRSEIGQIESDLMLARSLVDEFSRRLNLEVADLVMEIRRLQTEIARKRMSRSDKAEDRTAYEEAKASQDEFEDSRKKLELEEADKQTLDPESFDTLNKCYKAGVKMAHPDRYMDDPEKCARATELMQELNELKRRRDLSGMQALVEKIMSGEAFSGSGGVTASANSRSTLEELEQVLEQLKQKRDSIYSELQELYLSDYYEQVVDTENWDCLVEAVRQKYKQQLRNLKEELSRMGG